MSHLIAGICFAFTFQVVVRAEPYADRGLSQKPLDPWKGATAGEITPPYQDVLLSLHKSLVEIESISGNENAVGLFLQRYLEEHGFLVKTQILPGASGKDGKDRFNVIARPESAPDGPEWRPRLIVTSHIDVVPPYIPYSIDADPDDPGSVSPDTVIRGRGSVDAKASVAAQVVAVKELLSGGAVSHDDLILVYVVGEETLGDGMRHFSRSLQVPGREEPLGFDAVIFGEPTENKLACGHKGIMGCTVSAKGKAGHSGYPWLGKSANEVLMRGLMKVVDAGLGSSHRYGNTTVNVGILEGGVAVNVIPCSAKASIAIRVAIGPQRKGHEVVRDRVDSLLKEVDSEALSMTCGNGYGVVECECDVEGFETIVVNYGTDIPNLVGNHTRYLYGPGDILVAHSDHEALTVRDLVQSVEGYKKLIKHALTARK